MEDRNNRISAIFYAKLALEEEMENFRQKLYGLSLEEREDSVLIGKLKDEKSCLILKMRKLSNCCSMS